MKQTEIRKSITAILSRWQTFMRCPLNICSAGQKTGSRSTPVSYTHLDVYKRQPRRWQGRTGWCPCHTRRGRPFSVPRSCCGPGRWFSALPSWWPSPYFVESFPPIGIRDGYLQSKFSDILLYLCGKGDAFGIKKQTGLFVLPSFSLPLQSCIDR